MEANNVSSSVPDTTPRVGAVITDVLAARQPQRLDPQEETHALQDLAQQMLERPDSFLPYLVQIAMRVSGACSAGISLHEPNAPEGDVFRWRYLTGACSPFIGRVSPRRSSPCGLCLDEGGPVLIAYPEQLYISYAMPNIISYEVLLVPIYVGGKEPLGALWVASHEKSRCFDSGDASILTELASFAGVALKMIRDTQALKQALAVQEILTREMRHRISNILTIAGGLVTASARTATTPEELAISVRGRLEALGRAQAIVHHAHGGEIFAGAPTIADFSCQLRALVTVISAPYSESQGRVALYEPSDADAVDIPIGQDALTALGLILHELATNAAKYGALSNAGGQIKITWHVEDETCVLIWEEDDGPVVNGAPATLGFGSNLIGRTIAGQLGGSAGFEWLPKGLRVTIHMSRKALSR